jgi:hypothetical protein
MSDRGDRPERVKNVDADEPFLSRWARLKRESREAPPPAPAPEVAPEGETPAAGEGADVREGEAEKAAVEAEPLELPPLDSLTGESDFSPFMRAGVDPELRRLALRKMWRNPKYNVVDSLDPYRADFKAFTALGDIVTADMKYHAERLLREQLERAAEAAEAPEEDATAAEGAHAGTAVAAGSGDAAAQQHEPESVADGGQSADDPEGPAEEHDERRDG